MMMKNKLYHITHPDYVDSIKKDGIHCSDDGYVYLVAENTKLSEENEIYLFDFVVLSSLFMNPYAVFEVDCSDIAQNISSDFADSPIYKAKLENIPTENIRYMGEFRLPDLPAPILERFKKNYALSNGGRSRMKPSIIHSPEGK